jgi:hypothetical protein
MMIDDELKALLLMSNLPPSWETFVTTVCNALATTIKYSETTIYILLEDARRKTFVQTSASEAYTVQSTGDREQHRGRSFSHGVALLRTCAWKGGTTGVLDQGEESDGSFVRVRRGERIEHQRREGRGRIEIANKDTILHSKIVTTMAAASAAPQTLKPYTKP